MNNEPIIDIDAQIMESTTWWDHRGNRIVSNTHCGTLQIPGEETQFLHTQRDVMRAVADFLITESEGRNPRMSINHLAAGLLDAIIMPIADRYDSSTHYYVARHQS